MNMTIKSLISAGVVALGLLSAVQAQASVVIAGTRVIYRAQETEVTIKLTNEGKAPALTQTWIDKGDPKAAPAAIEVPFTVTPPVSRIDPGKGQTLRILYTGEPLAQDRESVFWLNVLEIPPKPSAEEAETNKLQLAFRSRIKLFFRPAGLKGTAEEAPRTIRWRIVQAGGKPALEGSNPSEYHVSFSRIEVVGGGKTARFEEGGMIAPGETRSFPLTGEVAQGPDTKIRFNTINDYGGAAHGEAALDGGATQAVSR
ncbi:fimbria/pilus periplasmic chaperone [Cupriavidus taiwanensis]|uniref:fimbria/pilus periplasmic chaperone n=1 Tax=Cupriavidus taiwanensis TaxID=164546 RepID=UPI00157268FA|nr:fimbria/pilus periplasmic chaperone [Cupriavidus taiwanensis]MDK3021180.1 fimbria/pilus periplasmic chaperone [Cupriavidus taiwanensis]NSX13553.1 fimbria/pilus periplasmic chaperone [Cupriavidus taiwanensis]